MKRGPAVTAFGFDGSSVGGDNSGGYGETYSGSAGIPVSGFIGTVKTLEDMRQVVRGNTDACVGNINTPVF